MQGVNNDEYAHLPAQVISSKKPHGAERWCDGWLVDVRRSVRYNGGTIIDGKWYRGYKCPPPVVPDGFELVSIHCGADLNAYPPMLPMLLRKKGNKD